MEILHGYAQREASGKRKRVVLRFLSSPVEILGDDHVEAVRVVRNELVRDEQGVLRARPTEDEEVIEAGVVFRAIGYTGVALPGLPFDERRGVIPNEGGRVEGMPRTYVAGWIKRGPSGVIGTNKKCAGESVATLLTDLAEGALDEAKPLPADEIATELASRQPGLVTYAGWEAIDEAERTAGEPHGRPRAKLTTTSELLDAAGVRAAAPSP
jgi:ferredoxin--NADP+ reductase